VRIPVRNKSANNTKKKGSYSSFVLESGFHPSHYQKFNADLASPDSDCGSGAARPPMKYHYVEPNSFLADVPGSRGLTPVVNSGSLGDAGCIRSQVNAQASLPLSKQPLPPVERRPVNSAKKILASTLVESGAPFRLQDFYGIFRKKTSLHPRRPESILACPPQFSGSPRTGRGISAIAW